MKEFKKTAVIIACIVLLWGQTVKAVSIPSFPYMPPADGAIWDMIYNMFGVVSLSGFDSEIEKAETYWNIYTDIVGVANDAIINDLKQAFDNAKTSRKIKLNVTQIGILNQALNKITTEGLVTERVEAQPPVTREEFIAKAGISSSRVTTQKYNAFVNDANNRFGTGNWTMCFIGGRYYIGKEPLYVYAYPKEYVLEFVERSEMYNNTYYTGAYMLDGIPQNVPNVCYRFRYDADAGYNDNIAFPLLTYGTSAPVSYIRAHYNWGAHETRVPVGVQNAEIADALRAGTDIPITANSVISNGALDTTRPVVWDLPRTLPKPATDVNDIPRAQEEMGVLPLPISENVSETVAQLQEQVSVSYGDTGDYSVDITMYFPFCIPFDLVRILAALDAEPEAPHFVFPLPSDIEGGQVVFTDYEFSLDWLSPVMVIVRKGELILGGIGIVLMTRELIRG